MEGTNEALFNWKRRFVPAFDAINRAVEFIVPEVILVLTVCIMFLTAPFLVSETGRASAGLRHRWAVLSLLSLLAAAFAWIQAPVTETALGPFRADEFAWFVRGLSLTVGILLVLVLWDQVDDARAAEAHACLLAILAGVNFVVLSNDLVGVFLGLELVSIPTYVLLYLGRQDWMSREATIKYFLLSIFSSALVLYGLSWVFGLAGTTNLAAIAGRSASGLMPADQNLFKLAMVLVIAGLSFRLTAVPFHFYAPDVFQGVTPSSAAMLSFVPKVVGFAALLRVLPACMGAVDLSVWVPSGTVRTILMILAVITMIAGNLMALRQNGVFRLLAYSSIAHAGYMLVGLTIGNTGAGTNGVAALLFYLATYGIMTIGVFALIVAAGREGKPVRAISDLAGLSRTEPALAMMILVCVIGLSGLPPTGGFFAKLNLFWSAWSAGSQEGRVLAIALAANAVVAAVYYLRLISVMYFEPSAVIADRSKQPGAWIAGLVCALCTIALFVAPEWLWSAANAALHTAVQ